MGLLRETGKSANSRGSDLMGLVEELEGLARGMGMGWEVEERWGIPPYPVGLERRLEMVRFRLGDLGRVARMDEGERKRAGAEMLEGR